MIMSPRRYSGRLIVGQALTMVGVLAILVIVLFPLLWMVLASIRPVIETLHDPPIWLPQQLTFSAYRKLLSDRTQLSFFTNTYIIATGTAALTVALGALCAYGFSRFHIRAARLVLLGVLALQ